MDFTYACGGKDGQVKTDKNIWSETLLDKAGTSASVELKNTGKSTLFARIITEGIPEQGEEKAYANGVSLAVSYVDLNGSPVNVAQLEQGTNFSAVGTVKNPSARGYNNLVLSEIFPAGWEILNTRFLNESATDSLSAGVNYQDIRDDRVYSYIDRLPAGSLPGPFLPASGVLRGDVRLFNPCEYRGTRSYRILISWGAGRARPYIFSKFIGFIVVCSNKTITFAAYLRLI